MQDKGGKGLSRLYLRYWSFQVHLGQQQSKNIHAVAGLSHANSGNNQGFLHTLLLLHDHWSSMSTYKENTEVPRWYRKIFLAMTILNYFRWSKQSVQGIFSVSLHCSKMPILQRSHTISRKRDIDFWIVKLKAKVMHLAPKKLGLASSSWWMAFSWAEQQVRIEATEACIRFWAFCTGDQNIDSILF